VVNKKGLKTPSDLTLSRRLGRGDAVVRIHRTDRNMGHHSQLLDGLLPTERTIAEQWVEPG
jgi:hypothetical protein